MKNTNKYKSKFIKFNIYFVNFIYNNKKYFSSTDEDF